MKIEIDTSSDSKESIRKAIQLLQSLVGESAEIKSNAGFFDSPSSGSGIFGSMFGDDSEPQPHDPNPAPGPQPPLPPETYDLSALQSLNKPKDDENDKGTDLETY